ncbi:MAG: ATP-dependent Clp protease ATP-binding subunit [Methylococcaceae bacterium]|nr:MAG: ATP-dependent Clp protease ATP-binding subunit [Methylococcaceae bacterium]
MPPTPRWLSDLERLLPIRSQFVVSGSIRDSFLTPLAPGLALVPLLRALWESLKAQDYQLLLVYDPADGVRVYPDEAAAHEWAERLFDVKAKSGCQPVSLETLANLMKNLVGQRAARCALVIDFASRLTRQPDHLAEGEHRFFVAAEKLSLNAAAVAPASGGRLLFNPVLWLVNRAQDLPSWFTLDSERVASLIIGKPDYETRQAGALQLAPLFAGYAAAPEAAQNQFVQRFTEGTEGMSLTALADITELADRRGLGFRDIEDVVRCYKVGALDNPWRKDYLREKIRDAQAFIEDRVKGQHQAVVKTLDILKRSVMGMTGAQARSGGSRPRGVLFFAGPTGVGKTELAKTLTQLVFGDERAYLRFDMSEFAEEHSSARLLGAPPGYIGFDAGGELTNAVREKPFSVVLFDEIEKAHPRILDKFLQILEDGRLTDGRGDTAYFSETMLVFTSNLGIYVEDAQGKRVQNVKPGDAYETVAAKVRQAIADYFKFKLSRPELLNRIGDNIVVFNFITPDIATLIFDGMLRNVARRLFEELKLQLSMPAAIRDELLQRCTHDLSDGGRGIGNQLESVFINPLSRALFEHDIEGKQRLAVTALTEQDKVIALSLNAT